MTKGSFSIPPTRHVEGANVTKDVVCEKVVLPASIYDISDGMPEMDRTRTDAKAVYYEKTGFETSSLGNSKSPPADDNLRPMDAPKLLDVSDMDDPTFNRYRIAKQLALVACWVCIGLFSEIVGPTFPDLRERLGVDYDTASWILVGRDVGMILGSLVGGPLNERFYHQMDLILSLSLFVPAVCTTLVPHMPSVIGVAVLFSLNGFCEGTINTGGIAMVMHLWGKKSGAAQLFLHFGFGVGSLVCPQIVKPFLGPDKVDDVNGTTVATPTAGANIGESRIEIPYGIIGVAVFIVAIVMLAFHIKKKPTLIKQIYRPTTSFSKEMLSPKSCARGHMWVGLELFLMIFLYYFQIAGGSRTIARFTFAYAYESQVGMSKQSAANLNTAYWIGFTGGRGLGALVAKVVPVVPMTACDVIGILITCLCLFFFGGDSSLGMWVCVPILGLFVGPLFPQGLTWSNYYLDMNPVGIIIPMIGANAGGFVYQRVMGSLFQKSPSNFLNALLFWASLQFVMYVIMQILAIVHGRIIGKGKAN